MPKAIDVIFVGHVRVGLDISVETPERHYLRIASMYFVSMGFLIMVY